MHEVELIVGGRYYVVTIGIFFKADHQHIKFLTQPNLTFIRLFHQGAQVKRSSCSHMIGGMILLQVKYVRVLPSFYTPFLSFSNTT